MKNFTSCFLRVHYLIFHPKKGYTEALLEEELE